MDNNLLTEAKLISSEEYMKLENPEFIGQSRLFGDNEYWMIFKDNDVLYKTHNYL